ncbi:MAG: ABC transporter permease [Lachnospiraceae bacterium]|nr:ABC transporter permease [Lachnospiraceae bacterium]
MKNFPEYCKMAFFNLRANKMRSFLTMLGIIIGISSVVMIFSCGDGIKNGLFRELEGIAGNYCTVTSFTGLTYTKDEIEDVIERVPHATDYMFSDMWVATGENTKGEFKFIIQMCGERYLETQSQTEIKKGRFFTKEEYDNFENGVVVDERFAKNVYGYTDIVGKEITVDLAKSGSMKCRIIGVVGDKQASSSLFVYSDKVSGMIYAPYTTVCNEMGWSYNESPEVIVFADSMDNVENVSAAIGRILRANHQDTTGDAVYVYELNSYMKIFNSILTAVTLFICFVAGISLLVGGIGVMNIMLVSVTERTKEIGIRKSLGARTSSILWQFLIESGTLSLLGGVIGMIFGYLGGMLLCFIAGSLIKSSILPSFNPFLVLGVSVFSAGIGIIFGIYPAGRAARLTPIEALRHR